jgi:HAD superfamily hydrolase (TIGR01509 family)
VSGAGRSSAPRAAAHRDAGGPWRAPEGVLFDCDGTLADTESLSDRAWTELLTSRGYRPTVEDFRTVVGHPFARNYAYFSERVPLGDPEEFRSELRSLFVELVERELSLHEDAVGTLRSLAGRGVPLAVVSSSVRSSVLRVLDQADATELVDVVVGADDVTAHKPDPEPYLTAARLLGVSPRRSVAVEDTGVGLAAAAGAGLLTVGVLRAHNDPSELAGADRIVEAVSLGAVSLDGPEAPRGG